VNPDFASLPSNLPVPVDDGACNHLQGLELPNLPLSSTSGDLVNLRDTPGLVVLFVYPLTGRPGVPLPEGWDAIPGARDCTPEACGFRDHYGEFHSLGATVFGLSTQSTNYQQEVRQRLQLQFDLLSDETGAFAEALRLPTFRVGDMRLLKRLTLICRTNRVEDVFYPVFPPGRHATEIIGFLHAAGAKH
jgi:peroxiredoxin